MNLQTFLSIALSLVLAWGCSHYAKRRGRNPMIWFAAGALFGIFALITLFILPVRKAAAKQVPEGPTVSKAPTLALLSPMHAEKFWYFLDDQKKQFGPMSFDALTKARLEGTVGEQTFVWNEEMENWQRFKDVIQPEQSPHT
ncbi:MAG: DUF4339 domain-containing protein [Verrucomicrobia bacterium]|nr:DUF4339 domain-containing protein [Verrucomicrobiota bacterium]